MDDDGRWQNLERAVEASFHVDEPFTRLRAAILVSRLCQVLEGAQQICFLRDLVASADEVTANS